MLVKVLAAGFYAKQDMGTPVRIGFIAMIANLVLNVALIWPLAHAGIALATSLAAIINSGFLFYFLRQRNFYSPRQGWKLFAIRLFIANLVLALWIYIVSDPLPYWLSQDTFWRYKHLGFLLISSMLIYFATLWITGLRLHHLLMPEQQLVSS